MNSLKDQFNQVSGKYDVQRPYLIPCYQDFYTICLPMIQRLGSLQSVLDIGAGTGLFSQFIYQQHPDVQFTLVDISGKMLDIAKERFAGLHNVSYQELDFSATALPPNQDLIISSLAIHHLEDQQKVDLYQKVFDALNPGGMFVNADQVEGRTPWFDDYYKTHWRAIIQASGLEQQAIDMALERIKLDKFAKLEWQLQTLQDVGFKDVDCIYKHNNFVVFGGVKEK